jgi:hypothetical protein
LTHSSVRKYTVRDVREGRYELRHAALNYAWNYTGDFEFVVDIQNMLRDGRRDEVNDFQIKGLLNTMLYDPRCAIDELPSVPRGRQPHLRVVEDPPKRRRAPFNVVLRWNRDYLVSTWKPTLTAHLLDKERSAIVWWPERGIYTNMIRAVCAVNLSRNFLLTVKEPRQGQHICRQCLLIQGRRNGELRLPRDDKADWHLCSPALHLD